ncbi:ROK family protein [Streptomyces dysideae]|uniref:Kanamycin kinase n=1 Tax=Streptomyces dysideae TaxID=909626 RepID=A0A101V5Y2_9ACTN|nr:ROK family protein [Streptomyces dysideae]KUO23039.1 kanamycin kinase [Streptomyces dysideae]
MSGITGFLGIDIGGTKVAVRVEGAGTDPLLTTFRWTSGADVREDLAALADCLVAVRRRWPGPLRAAGVALPATLDSGGRVTAWPNRPAWAGLSLAAELHGMLPGTAVACADDGDLAALAEAGVAGLDDILYVGVGTGVGGGAVLGGELCPGPARGSFELGHLVIDRAGTRCDCGRRGCVQAHASGPAILRRATELRDAPVTYADLCDAWQRQLSWAVVAVDEGCAALATAIISAAELLRPDAVVVGGGFAEGLPGFTPRVARHTHHLTRPGHPAPTHHEAQLGGLSSLHGAVQLARTTSATIPTPVLTGSPAPG